jgi:hypothetical protein
MTYGQVTQLQKFVNNFRAIAQILKHHYAKNLSHAFTQTRACRDPAASTIPPLVGLKDSEALAGRFVLQIASRNA